jgi:hypothetical protein
VPSDVQQRAGVRVLFFFFAGWVRLAPLHGDMDPSLLSTDTIKMGGGLGAAVISNLTGIPFDRFRVGVAQVRGSATSRTRPTYSTARLCPLTSFECTTALTVLGFLIKGCLRCLGTQLGVALYSC